MTDDLQLPRKAKSGFLLPLAIVLLAAIVAFGMLAMVMHSDGPSPVKDFVDHLVKHAGLGGVYDRIEETDEQGRHLMVAVDEGRLGFVELDGRRLPEDRYDRHDDVLTVRGEDGAVLFTVPLTREAGWLMEVPAGADREAYLEARRAEHRAERERQSEEEERVMAAIGRTDELLAAELARRLVPALETALRATPESAALGDALAALPQAERDALCLRAARAVASDLSRDTSVRLMPDGAVWLVVLTQADQVAKELEKHVPRELKHAGVALDEPARAVVVHALRELAKDFQEVELLAEAGSGAPAGTPAEPPSDAPVDVPAEVPADPSAR